MKNNMEDLGKEDPDFYPPFATSQRNSEQQAHQFTCK